MSEITAITPQIKDKTRCNIFIDGVFYCGLKLETTVKYRLKVGKTVDPAFLNEIQLESEKSTALDKALTHISASQKTEKQIADFLKKKGYLPATIEYVLEKMREYRFVDDAEYAARYAEQSAKKKGGRLIKMELRSKGIAEESIEAAIGEIDGEEQLEAAKTILQKYLRGKEADALTLQKAYRHLLSKGFDYDTAKSAIEAFKTLDEYE
ncbi:MAG: RecX family transcriptional regulator [Clostridia bacterium]|nr:RecX family transcriptional regulator [Clostridia bacterium]